MVHVLYYSQTLNCIFAMFRTFIMVIEMKVKKTLQPHKSVCQKAEIVMTQYCGD